MGHNYFILFVRIMTMCHEIRAYN